MRFKYINMKVVYFSNLLVFVFIVLFVYCLKEKKIVPISHSSKSSGPKQSSRNDSMALYMWPFTPEKLWSSSG